MLLVWAFVAVFLATGSAFAFQSAPKASAKALGVTRGKQFSGGLVFVNGKYLEPPYVVERWGTCIRINGTPVTGQVVDWNEFLKTQPGVKVVKAEAEVPATEPSTSATSAAAEPAPSAPVVSETPTVTATEAAESLDDLFDDDPKPAKKKSATSRGTTSVQARQAPAPRKPPAKPRAAVTYVLDEPFVSNEASKALMERINVERTKIDRALRSGGFIFFGDSYSRVTGDARTLSALLGALPELQQNSKSMDAFRQGVNAANLFYINGPLCEELYENRIDYRKLKERRDRIKRSAGWDQVLQGAGESLY